MTLAATTDRADLVTQRDRLRALAGSAIGSTIEWFDYFLYGTMAVLVFGKLFFPSTDPLISQMLALTTFALAFLVRPLGGIFFSHIGDRIGRKKTLVVTLSLMGGSTAAMGLLPTYDMVGLWAPVMLTVLRLLQGLALGGEWGGGLLLAVEYSPRHRRGLYGAIPQLGALLGLALGNIVASLITSALSEDAFVSWGWRVPFVASIVLVFLGLWIRKQVAETPSFRKVLEAREVSKVPLVETLKNYRPQLFTALGAKAIEASSFFFFATFMVYYLPSVGFERSQALNAVLLAALVGIVFMPLFGALSDRIGRKRVFLGGALAMVLYAIPFFWLVNQGSYPLAVIALVLGLAVIWTTYGSTLGTLLAESFPPEIRYTGTSLPYHVGAAIVGGPMPLIATALLAKYDGNYLPIALFLMGCGTVSLVAVWFIEDKTGRNLDS
ncbi:MAG: MFS transporter [Pseudomonadota bacterium]|nr:MFS transporter [Pseudomonadota bacterium]